MSQEIENPTNENENIEQVDPEVLEFQERLLSRVRYTWATCLILLLCVLNYLWLGYSTQSKGFIDPTGEALVSVGADFAPLTLSGQWWRMITCAFVHIGVVHFTFNLLCFTQIATLIERLYGSFLFLLLFLGSAVTGSLLSLAMNQEIISAGASGAIFGLYGVLIAYCLRYPNEFPKSCLKGTLNTAIAFVAYNLFFGLQAGIDNWAHLGGLAGGFVFGLAAAIPVKTEDMKSYFPSRFALLVILIPLCTIPFYFTLSQPYKVSPSYSQFADEYSKIENEIFSLAEPIQQKTNEGKEVSDAEYLEIFVEQLPKWNQAREICQQFKPQMNEWNQIQKDVFVKIERYVELKIEMTQLMIEGIRSQSEDLMKQASEKAEEIQRIEQELTQ